MNQKLKKNIEDHIKRDLEKPFVISCMYCKDILRRGYWSDVGKPLYKMIEQYATVSHGCCPRCKPLMYETLRKYKNQ